MGNRLGTGEWYFNETRLTSDEHDPHLSELWVPPIRKNYHLFFCFKLHSWAYGILGQDMTRPCSCFDKSWFSTQTQKWAVRLGLMSRSGELGMGHNPKHYLCGSKHPLSSFCRVLRVPEFWPMSNDPTWTINPWQTHSTISCWVKLDKNTCGSSSNVALTWPQINSATVKLRRTIHKQGLWMGLSQFVDQSGQITLVD